MTARLRMPAALAAAVALAALAAALGPATADARRITYQGFYVATKPTTPGVTIHYKDRRFVTGADGRVFIRAPRDLLTPRDRHRVKNHLDITSKEIEPGVRVRLARWYDKANRTFTAALDRFYRVEPRYTIQGGKPVDPSRIESITLKSRHGIRVTSEGAKPLWLHGKRIVPTLGQLAIKDIQWTVESVKINGQNVVNRSQQEFVPAVNRDMEVKLLFYRLKVSARDALLKFPIGSAVLLRYPNGKVERHEFESAGDLTFEALPRGSYKLRIEGPGYSFERPVSVSRNQEAELDVLSYLDIVLVALILIGIAVGLVFVGRPELYEKFKRRLRRLRRRRATVGAG
jgi:hypothetical protein